jgi:uncharacterized membrane protein
MIRLMSLGVLLIGALAAFGAFYVARGTSAPAPPQAAEKPQTAPAPSQHLRRKLTDYITCKTSISTQATSRSFCTTSPRMAPS